jgi:hypothetical protein
MLLTVPSGGEMLVSPEASGGPYAEAVQHRGVWFVALAILGVLSQATSGGTNGLIA